MADTQPDTFVSAFLPESEEPVDEGIDIDELPAEEEMVVEEPPLVPLGRSWSFDFTAPGIRTIRNRGPFEVQGLATLRGWIEKCLRTPRGAYDIHPDDYGVEGMADLYGQPVELISTSSVSQSVRDALTFHPRISDVVDFDFAIDPDDEAMYLTFTVVVDNANDRDELVIDDFPLVV